MVLQQLVVRYCIAGTFFFFFECCKVFTRKHLHCTPLKVQHSMCAGMCL